MPWKRTTVAGRRKFELENMEPYEATVGESFRTAGLWWSVKVIEPGGAERLLTFGEASCAVEYRTDAMLGRFQDIALLVIADHQQVVREREHAELMNEAETLTSTTKPEKAKK